MSSRLFLFVWLQRKRFRPISRDVMASKDQPILPTTVDPKVSSSPTVDKQRGANRTSKTAQKLKALPDVPEPLTQSAIITREKQKQKEDEGVTEPDIPQLVAAEEEEEDVEVRASLESQNRLLYIRICTTFLL